MNIGSRSRGLHCELAKTLSFPIPTMVGADVPFHLKFALKVTHHLWKRQLWPISAYNVSTVRASKKVQRAFQQAIEEVRTLPLSPQRVAQKVNLSFWWTKINLNQTNSATKFLCVKTSNSRVPNSISTCENFQSLNLIFSPKVTHSLQQSWFRRISASEVRASKKKFNYRE